MNNAEQLVTRVRHVILYSEPFNQGLEKCNCEF